jgi:hypothetical protein
VDAVPDDGGTVAQPGLPPGRRRPERLSLEISMALLDIRDCPLADLIESVTAAGQVTKKARAADGQARPGTCGPGGHGSPGSRSEPGSSGYRGVPAGVMVEIVATVEHGLTAAKGPGARPRRGRRQPLANLRRQQLPTCPCPILTGTISACRTLSQTRQRLIQTTRRSADVGPHAWWCGRVARPSHFSILPAVRPGLRRVP